MGRLIQQGEKGKSFLLKDNRDKDVQLSDFEGKKVLLSFHPLAWTGVCAKQMKALEKNKKKFDRLNTVALGLSIDTVPSKNAWAKTLGIRDTHLLCDFWPHGKIAKAYGLFRAANGFSERANVILDEKHRVIFVKVYPIAQLPDLKEIMHYLAASCEVSEDRNGMIMPPHPTLSRGGRGNSVTPQQAAGNHPD